MKNVYVFLAEGFEEIEALSVVDFLRRAEINVTTVSITEENVVRGAHDIYITADTLFTAADFSEADMFVLPGGLPGATNLGAFKPLCILLKEADAKGTMIAAICAAPTVFGKLGLLNGRAATCYPGLESALTGAECKTDKVVIDNNIITSRGPATALPFALALIEKLLGKEAADGIAEDILYKL